MMKVSEKMKLVFFYSYPVLVYKSVLEKLKLKERQDIGIEEYKKILGLNRKVDEKGEI